MKYLSLLFFAWSLALFPGASSAADEQCKSASQLEAHSGHYAKKTLWDGLATVKVWSKANQRFNEGWISAVDIDAKGAVFGNYAWHEGGTPCIQFRDGALWAADTQVLPLQWEGPFVRVGTAGSDKVLYFNRVFGDACYASKIHVRWCFNEGQLTVGKKHFSAHLLLDTFEAPT